MRDFYEFQVCKLIRQVTIEEALQTSGKFIEVNLKIYGPQITVAARIMSKYPNSKVAKENLDGK